MDLRITWRRSFGDFLLRHSAAGERQRDAAVALVHEQWDQFCEVAQEFRHLLTQRSLTGELRRGDAVAMLAAPVRDSGTAWHSTGSPR